GVDAGACEPPPLAGALADGRPVAATDRTPGDGRARTEGRLAGMRAPISGGGAAVSTREEILGNLRRGRAREGGERQRQQSVEARLSQPSRGPVPARADLDLPGLLTLFETKANEASATVVRDGSSADEPAAVAAVLADGHPPAERPQAPEPRLH